MVFLFLAFCAKAFAGESQLQKATNVVNEFRGKPDKGIPDELVEKAVCVGIVPSQLKFALGVWWHLWTRFAGVPQRWQRCVGARLPCSPWVGGSFEFQIGGKSSDVVFIVMNAVGAKSWVQDSVKLGAEASATAGPVGSVRDRRYGRPNSTPGF